MRHRLGGLGDCICLGGNNEPCELDNSWSENEALNIVADEMFDDALETLFKPSDIYSFDYKVVGNEKEFQILFGFEPAYRHDPYLMFCISSNQQDSHMKKGVARGYYGKDVEIAYDKKVTDNDCDKAFMAFVERWYPQLMETVGEGK